jgi:hypothetical protein
MASSFRGDFLSSSELVQRSVAYSQVLASQTINDAGHAAIAGVDYARSVTGIYGAGIDANELTVGCPSNAKRLVWAAGRIAPRVQVGLYTPAEIECASKYFTMQSVSAQYQRFTFTASRNTCGTVVGPNIGQMYMVIDVLCVK